MHIKVGVRHTNDMSNDLTVHVYVITWNKRYIIIPRVFEKAAEFYKSYLLRASAPSIPRHMLNILSIPRSRDEKRLGTMPRLSTQVATYHST